MAKSPQTQSQRRHRSSVLAWLCGGHPYCERCGVEHDPAALVYHHRTPVRQSRSRGRSTAERPLVHQRITDEKLSRWRVEGNVLCCNCHALIHYYDEEVWFDKETPTPSDCGADARRGASPSEWCALRFPGMEE